MRRLILAMLIGFNFALGTFAQANQTYRIVTPGPLDGHNVRNPFVEELLHLIFERQGLNLDLVYNDRTFTQGRALKELSESDTINLNWSATSKERQQNLRAIEIPLYQGLIGWRVLLIKQGEQSRFNTIESLEMLKSLVAVQRFDWPDYQVLKENGLNVEGNLSFENHSLAVNDGIADYFPRSVLEIVREAKESRNSGLSIESSIILKYPAAYYFFVNKDNEELARVIEKGFRLLLKDGGYISLFQAHFGEQLKSLKLDNRRVFNLKNSTFPSQGVVAASNNALFYE
ncbi:substrate-binding periplasmic protein [Thalassotalea euphylliae]|uniref:substrate-binding periplasmic protein n=1 Tax=Thalassotalea euphylliae TaxID=1655234 RepID=UPI00362CAA06